MADTDIEQAADAAAKPVDLEPVMGWVEVLRAIKVKRGDLDELEARAREHIETALGEAELGTVDGEPAVRWSHVKGRSRINAAALRAELPDVAKKYTVIGEPSRRFELLEVAE